MTMKQKSESTEEESATETRPRTKRRVNFSLISFNPDLRGFLSEISTLIKKSKPFWSEVLLQRRGYTIQNKDNRYELILEVPGCNPKTLKVETADVKVIVSGEKFPVMGGAPVKFQRALVLPASASFLDAKAIHRNGLLKVVLPKAQSDLRKEIEVSIEDDLKQPRGRTHTQTIEVESTSANQSTPLHQEEAVA